MKSIIIAVLMVFILSGVGFAMVQGPDQGTGTANGPNRYGARPDVPGPWRALNLSPEQRQKMQELQESFFKESIPLRNEITTKRFELRALWMQPNPDEGKILAKQKEINALRSDLQEKSTKKRLEMRRILTPEQQAEWTYLRDRYRSWRDKGGGPGFGHSGYGNRGYGMGMMGRGYDGGGPRW